MMKTTFIVLIVLFISICQSFNLEARSNFVIYYGQDSANDGSQKMLSTYCNDSTYDVFILSFVDVFFSGETYNGAPLPEVNLANLCPNTFSDYPLLMDCPEMGADIEYCQSKGKVVTISLGGASGAYGFSSAQQATTYANTIWNMFLGGNDSYPRPFGNAILDGVDLDIEGGSSQYYDVFVTTLKKNYFAGASKRYYISGAPQCPFPDAYLQPAMNTGLFDFVNIQFYNNYCELTTSFFNFNDWSNWAGNHSSTTKLFVGLPAGPAAAGSGYVPPAQVTKYIQPLLSNPQFGGIMSWDLSISEEQNPNFAAYLSQYLKKNAPAPSDE